MVNRLLDDCFRPGQQLSSHDEAIALLEARIAPVTATERVALVDACGRILAEPAIAGSPVPAHTNAAVDGYAFAHHDLVGDSGDLGRAWPIAGRSAAGHPFRGLVSPGEVVRIFTGAVMPDAADTVIMQEDTDVVPGANTGPDSGVEIGAGMGAVRMRPGTLKRGANVRRAGEDVAAGATLLAAGALIRPQDLAALASIGLGDVACRKPLRVAIVSTGDEVVRAGSRALSAGEVYDANAPMLAALAKAAGAEVHDLGILPDSADAVRDGLAAAAGAHDVILSTGGASRGEEDHVAGALAALGTHHFWQIKVKPGRPMMLGQIGGSVVVGLPGNPVAVFVCFLMYVQPMLRRLGGAPWPRPRRLMLPATFAFPGRRIGRREFWRGMIRETPRGLAVDKFARDGSGLISSLREADCLIDIPEDVPEVRVGDPVAVIPFTEFGIV